MRLVYSEDSADILLKKLNKHFKAEPFEEYPDASINQILDRVVNTVVGNDYNKQTFSQRNQKKIYDIFLRKVQDKYGEWVNVTNFKTSGLNFKFSSNFKGIFKNKKGRLYGSYTPEDLFITSHCLERFEERIDTDRFKSYFYAIIDRLKRKIKTEPTALDILREMLVTAAPEYAISSEDNIFFNIRSGVLVLHKIEDIFIALTFLTYEMVEDFAIQWKKVMMEKKKYDTFTELFNKFDTVNIKLIDSDAEEEE